MKHKLYEVRKEGKEYVAYVIEEGERPQRTNIHAPYLHKMMDALELNNYGLRVVSSKFLYGGRWRVLLEGKA